ncbi:MAG: iron-containing alcohol dehydrogenase, partial [Fusobacteriaceae bacterium]
MIIEGINRMEQFFKSIGMPITLEDAKLKDIDDRFKEMAKKAVEKGNIGQFVKLNSADIVEIYKLCKA